ncbi:MAG: AMP-binding protein [Actinobacteria bacterium]|nr:AMP-binding protein [Actinomycetota bacterium]MBU1944039.1 AMP-binding protein [Actinomycetota bacterium]MBU2688535.1 AMP-binding protein [Actinomycetota bacterium]
MPGLMESLRTRTAFPRFIARALGILAASELRKGTLHRTAWLSLKNRGFTIADATLLGDLQERKARENGGRAFLGYEGRMLSYRDMDRNSNLVAHGLLDSGLGPGDGVAIMMRNCPEYLDVFYATQKTGMYAVPVNTSLKGDGLVHIMGSSESRAVVVDHCSWESFAAVRDRLPGIDTVVFDGGEDATVPEEAPPGCIDLASFYEGDGRERPAARPVRGELSLLLYTSGTTGLPKGTVFRYGDSRIDFLNVVGRLLYDRDDNLYTYMPLFHGNALMVSVVPALFADARMTLAPRFSARRFWDDVRECGATTFNAVGAVLEILERQPPSPRDREHDVRMVIGASNIPDTIKAFEERFGLEILTIYGATDSGLGVMINVCNAPKGSMGKPVASKCRVITEEGGEARPGEVGELQMYLGKGRPIEYYGDDRATGEKVVDGWVMTGDMVTRDEKNNYYFVGRDIERIRRRGENITCLDVEREVFKHPAVEECAVYGVPSDLGEDEVMVAVVLREGAALEPAELTRFLDDKLAAFSIPRYVRFMDELPKNELFKIIKKDLQADGVTPDTHDCAQ